MSGEIHNWPIPPEIDQARKVSHSTEEEVQALLDRGAPYKSNSLFQRLSWSVPLGGAVLLAAVFLLWFLTPSAPGVRSGDFVTLDQGVQILGESIQFTGHGALHVESTGVDGHRLRLLEGKALFTVDPKGVDRNLIVYAGQSAVQVTGTVFGVSRNDDITRVWVERGSVAITHLDSVIQLTAGNSWSPPPVQTVQTASTAAAVEEVHKEENSATGTEETMAVKPGQVQAKETATSNKSPRRFADTPASNKIFNTIEVEYALVGTTPDLYAQVNTFVRKYPRSRHHETVSLYQIEMSEGVESDAWRLQKINEFLRKHPKSKHRRGLKTLRAHLKTRIGEK